jgi:glutamate-ammonia-ligase adenylyltransferase
MDLLKNAMAWSPWFAKAIELLDDAQREALLAAVPVARGAEHWLALAQAQVADLPSAESRLLPELARGVDPRWQARLRQWRRIEQLRMVARDMAGLSSMPELTAELSYFADAAIAVALPQAHAEVALLHGQPIGRDSSQPQSLVVIGMGKLGGYELNLSSDIDLIFSYEEDGETDGRRSIGNQEFFIKVGQRLIALLDPITADGFVFRVDMRLRPWGDGSALAASFDALESYYERHGREWERYALIKARVCAGEKASGARLMKSLKPFVYRRYIDFGVFESLREMKTMIAREVRRLDREDNIKLGSGGIREIEFIAQAFQLIRGGIDIALQARELLIILPLLAERELLPQKAVDELIAAYHFLRDCEHRIQALHDQQTQTLPTDTADRQRLAEAMGYADWLTFSAALDVHRAAVNSYFQDVVAAREAESAEATTLAAWPEAVQALIDSRASQQLGSTGQLRLKRLLPLLVAKCQAHEHPELALLRVLPLIEATLRRSAYLMLLIENPQTLSRLVDLCAASPWIAEALARHPVLLDELLNAGTLFAPPSAEALAADLRAQLVRIPEDDLERQMDVLRIFQKGHVLRVAASDLKGTLALMKISDALTWIAEVVLQEVLTLCWRQLVAKHGRPQHRDGSACEPGFIIVGYGKLGGIELGYGSDLDLVFIHDGDASAETDGAKPLDTASFYARLGQKIIHMMTTAMATGLLYDVDMRLRPSGASGLLVTSLDGFAKYQAENAWTWEHQALVRARVVAGDAALAQSFARVREELLQRPRDAVALRVEVVEMRQKMRDHLAPKEPNTVDLKHSPGGLVDIEFLVQYLALAHAHAHPEICQWPDNMRLLETCMAANIISAEVAQQLMQAYISLRARGHRQALANEGRLLGYNELLSERESVQQIWRQVMVL